MSLPCGTFGSTPSCGPRSTSSEAGGRAARVPGALVAAADAERRRIERDLHDGAQQHLVRGSQLRGRAGARRLGSDDSEAILAELRASAQRRCDEFRDLAHGIYPPLLVGPWARGGAREAAARADPARLEAAAGRPLRRRLEATVYFCCLEALQNAGKHAGAEHARPVRSGEEEGGLLFEVADDGSGLAPARGGRGAGLTNMDDRLGALGGQPRIESAPGRRHEGDRRDPARFALVVPARRGRGAPPLRAG